MSREDQLERGVKPIFNRNSEEVNFQLRQKEEEKFIIDNELYVPSTGVDRDRGGESGRRNPVSPGLSPVSLFTSSLPIHPGTRG